MALTRKHFKVIAEAVAATRALYPDVPSCVWAELTANLAAMCRKENPRFDSGRFVDACTPGNDAERLLVDHLLYRHCFEEGGDDE